MKKHFKAVDAILVENGILPTILIRLTPAPFGMMSYIFGVTSIKTCHFVIGTTGFLRGIITNVMLGAKIYEIEVKTKKKLDVSEL